MSCNTCFKSFSLLRSEKGCPSCGFSYCSKCLNHKIFVPKINGEAKVCLKCKGVLADSGKKTNVSPPDALFKLAGSINPENSGNASSSNDEVRRRLDKLRQNKPLKTVVTDDEIQARLQNIRETPSTTDAELHARLTKLRGFELPTESKPILMTKDLRTEQEQVEDLMKQYVDNAAIDNKYKDEFDVLVSDMEARVQKLRGEGSGSQTTTKDGQAKENTDAKQTDSDEEEDVMKIVEKIKAQAMLEEDEISPSTNDELPFCEICNEDATLRCLGCRYLFCKRCFNEHREDDDDCNRSEPYRPPKGNKY